MKDFENILENRPINQIEQVVFKRLEENELRSTPASHVRAVFFKDKVQQEGVRYGKYLLIEEQQKVYYGDKEMEMADFASFYVYSYSDRWNRGINQTSYANDKNHLYYKDSIADQIDKTSFRIIDDRYAADKDHVYFDNEPIPMVDLNTFQVINWAHALDKNRYYFKGKETKRKEHIRYIKEQLEAWSKK